AIGATIAWRTCCSLVWRSWCSASWACLSATSSKRPPPARAGFWLVRPPGGRKDTRAYLLLIGLAFMVLGFMGLFIGNLIKAAASRQREFLADASAVHFT